MATKTIADNGPLAAFYVIQRDPLVIKVRIQTDDGDWENVDLTAAEVNSIGTAQQRQTVAGWFDNGLHPFALTKAGFTG